MLAAIYHNYGAHALQRLVSGEHVPAPIASQASSHLPSVTVKKMTAGSPAGALTPGVWHFPLAEDLIDDGSVYLAFSFRCDYGALPGGLKIKYQVGDEGTARDVTRWEKNCHYAPHNYQ